MTKYPSKFPSLYTLWQLSSLTQTCYLCTLERDGSNPQPPFPISVDLLQKPPLPPLSVPPHPALLPTLASASGLPLYQLSWISPWALSINTEVWMRAMSQGLMCWGLGLQCRHVRGVMDLLKVGSGCRPLNHWALTLEIIRLFLWELDLDHEK